MHLRNQTVQSKSSRWLGLGMTKTASQLPAPRIKEGNLVILDDEY